MPTHALGVVNENEELNTCKCQTKLQWWSVYIFISDSDIIINKGEFINHIVAKELKKHFTPGTTKPYLMTLFDIFNILLGFICVQNVFLDIFIFRIAAVLHSIPAAPIVPSV